MSDTPSSPMIRNGSSNNMETAEVSNPVSNSSDATMPKREVTITIGHPDYNDFERDVPEEVLQNAGVPPRAFHRDGGRTQYPS
jgi:hypothetical protein